MGVGRGRTQGNIRVRFQVLTAAGIKTTVLWDLASCSVRELDWASVLLKNAVVSQEATNQKLPKGGVLRKRKTSSHAISNQSCDWNRDRKYNSWGYAYCNGLLSRLWALTCSDWGGCCYWRAHETQAICLYENNFGWMGVWVEPRGMGSLCPKASATSRGFIMIGTSGHVPFFDHS
jgi:hypothetical protein